MAKKKTVYELEQELHNSWGDLHRTEEMLELYEAMLGDTIISLFKITALTDNPADLALIRKTALDGICRALGMDFVGRDVARVLQKYANEEHKRQHRKNDDIPF